MTQKNTDRITVAIIMAFVAAVLAFVIPMIAHAAGHIGLRNLDGTLRGNIYRIPVNVLNNAEGNTTDNTAGVDGVLAVSTMNGVTSFNLTSFSPTPYPCKLDLIIKEATAGGTLTCTGDVVINGTNYLGDTISETITSDIVETTPVTSAKVYASVTSFTTSGCSGGAEANDVLRVQCSPWVGLPLRITNGAAFLSVCGFDTSANSSSCYSYTTLVTGETDIELATVTNGYTPVINVGGLVGETPNAFGGTLADGDQIFVRYRWPAGK